ncbi:MAG: HAMP domain-containing histidine kinase [Defluviitaleaceae bacterium]|nr:HAMP domain-containing histidine kinase [Defluviitaleaceae bacterium]
MSKKNNKKILHYENLFHDMKNPMTVLFSTIQVMEGKDSEKKFGKETDILRKSAFQMMKLINYGNDIEKIIQDDFEPNMTSFNIVDSINQLIYIMNFSLEKTNTIIKFNTNVNSKIICNDEFIIYRIIMNLISNAIKFSDEKNRKIEIVFKDEDDFIKISVKDNGPGIEEDMLKKMFKRYETKNKEKGFGIGLNIVENLLSIINGSVKAKNVKTKNNEIKGAIFTIKIPANKDKIEEKSDKKSMFVDDFHKKNLADIEFSDLI